MFTRIDLARPRAVVGWAVLTGLVAGLLAAIYFSIAGEPLIDDAIAIEERTAAQAAHDGGSAGGAGPEDHDDSVVVSRSDQRGAGLFTGYALFGAAYGLLLAITALSLRGTWLDPFRRVLVGGVILATAFTVVPWFKYPPNPPAVGDPATADQRQRLYLLLIALTAVVLAGAAHLSSRLRRAGWDEARRSLVVGAAGLVALAVVLIALPADTDPIPVEVPTSLIWRFRVASLGGNLLLWALLTVGFGALWSETFRRRVTAPAPVPAPAPDPAPRAGEASGGGGALSDAERASAPQNSMPFIAEMPSS